MNIVVGSTSPHKLEAVRQACAKLEIAATIRGVAAESFVANQPFGLDEIVRGARTRSAAYAPDADLAVGIENGITSAFSLGLMYFDVAAVAVRKQGKIVGTSLTPGIVVPNEFVEDALRRGAWCTVAAVMHTGVGSDATDVCPFLTGGRYSRVDQLVAGVVAAFAQARIP